ncbi:MAG: hypothetical protein RR655_07790, partial [Raoultibacter sp.]
LHHVATPCSIFSGTACAHCSSNFCKHHKTFGEKNLQFVMNSKSSDMNNNKRAFPGYFYRKRAAFLLVVCLVLIAVFPEHSKTPLAV